MSVKHPPVPRSKMSAGERRFRSRLAQVIAGQGLIRGSLLVRRRVCGKPRCRCTRGRLHESLYLAIHQDGRTRQLFVPKDWEARVRQWVEQYHHAQELLEEVSKMHWEKLRQRQD